MSGRPEMEASEMFPLEDIVQHPLPGYAVPTNITFPPDDSFVSYLHSADNTLSRQLYAFDPSTWQQRLLASPPGGGLAENNLSRAEKLRRERARERGLGITRYDWSKASPSPILMVPLPDGVYIQDGQSEELRLCVPAASGQPILDPQLSPDGKRVAFVVDNELFVASTGATHSPVLSAALHPSAVETALGLPGQAGVGQEDPGVMGNGGDQRHAGEMEQEEVDETKGKRKGPLQLTFGAKGNGLLHGLAEYIAQEEMERRNGFWWSSDSTLIAFTEVDPKSVPTFKIIHQGKPVVGAEAEEDHAYPFAGETNVGVRLGVVSAEGGDVVWMDLNVGGRKGSDGEDEEYLARVMWMPDNSLAVQVQSRSQTRLRLLRLDVSSGHREVLLVEESSVWVNLNDCFTPLQKGLGAMRGGFIWASERTGFRHLYMYDGRGRCLGALTEGEWMVDQVAGVDEVSQTVYFTATLDSPLEVHLYAIHWVVEEQPCGGSSPLQPSSAASLLSNATQVPHFTSPDPPPARSFQPPSYRIEGATAVAAPQGLNSKSPEASPGLFDSQPGSAPHQQKMQLSAPSSSSSSPFSVSSSCVATIGLRRLTHGQGRHSVVLDHQLHRYVDVYDSLSSPPRVTLCSLQGDAQELAVIFEHPSPPSPQLQRLTLLPPELINVQASDGTTLHGALYRPDQRVFGPPPYPTVVSVYGGPHVQTVVNSWVATVDMRAQYLRSRGVLVWKLDNRGSSRRGLQFEGVIKHRMGTIDVEDQAVGVNHIVSQGLADPKRIGIYGWSYGGYLAAMCLARRSDLFKCAVAGAPVTSWDGYDTHYTERYMGKPKENEEAYEKSSVMTHAGGIEGKLMLVHGMIDENVHFRHTVRLINTLTSNAKEYELLVFPEERHMPRARRERVYMEARIFDFLNKALGFSP